MFTRQLQARIDQATTILWNVVALIVILGLLATVLAAAGIYGAVSFAVGRRMHELGMHDQTRFRAPAATDAMTGTAKSMSSRVGKR